MSTAEMDEDLEHAQFWDMYLNTITRLVHWMRVPEQDIPDIVNQVAHKSQKKWHSRRVRTPQGTYAWIQIILRNTVADYYRHRRREQQYRADFNTNEEQETILENIESEGIYFDGAAWLQTQDRANRLWEAVLRLKEPDYSMVVLHYYEDVSQKEIATHLNLPYDTVKKRLQRVLKKLWQILKDDGYERDDF
jgi:RNA polymerase sigma-70 factor (ECF subfamily)